jgi:hypothetical protein
MYTAQLEDLASHGYIVAGTIPTYYTHYNVFSNGRVADTFKSTHANASLPFWTGDMIFTLNQLVGDEWSFGARYQLSYSNLQTIFPEIPTAVAAGADHREKATLHQGQLFALYNHRSGFFGRIEGYWARQSNVGYAPDIPGDDIFQLNAYVGYRFRRNYGDVTLGFLNMTDQDYKLNPLNYYNELPRERTLVARVRLNF